MRKKSLQDLTIKDPFMFAAVMNDPENCAGLLRMVLDIPIDHVVVETEKSLVYHPEFHGVRLDVYAKDEAGSRFNVEMQVRTTAIEHRSRYYQAQMDTDALKTGHSYDELPDVYVIFICDYDPFDCGNYVYTVRNLIAETGQNYDDGRHAVFLNTCGTNENEVSSEIVSFLRYVHADLAASNEQTSDIYVQRLQKSVDQIKKDRDMEDRYMLFEDMIKMERRDAMREGMQKGMQKGMQSMILEILNEKNILNSEIEHLVRSETDTEKLKQYNKAALHADSAEEFLCGVKNI